MAVDLTETRARAKQIAAEWGLVLGEPFSMSNVSLAIPAGGDKVLKVQWEGDTESLHEAEAFEEWDGYGAVRLLRKGDRALLEERAVPGTDISSLPEDEATAIAVDIATKLWRPASAPFRRVVTEVPMWLDLHPSKLTPLARHLWGSFEPRSEWLVHGDFHHHNVLRHGDRYVAIDPKPYLGEREYDVPSFLWNPLGYELDDAEKTERRIAAFVAAGLDEFRIRAWTAIRGAYLRGDGPEVELISSWF
jgi:streptomycin 6-kinase